MWESPGAGFRSEETALHSAGSEEGRVGPARL